MTAKDSSRAKRLIWIDLEMSGLEPESDVILEAAVIITDSALNTVIEWESWVVHQPDDILDNMDAWNKRMHGNSGLIDRCRSSTNSAAKVERDIIKELSKYIDKKSSPMCGNSICQDRRFLARYMPKLEDFFHYRNFDVSSFKIAAQMYYPDLMQTIKQQKESSHQALDDIRASIREMLFYREHMLVKPEQE